MKKKNLLQRTILIALVTLFGLYIVIGPRHRPSLKDFGWSGIKATLASNIHLGLDLKGGSHLVMRVKTEEFLKHLTEGNAVAADNAAKEAGFEVKAARADISGGHRVVVQVADPSKAEAVKEAIQKKVELGDTSTWSYALSGDQLIWTMTGGAERNLADNATTQALNIIDSRINALGITEPTLQTHGSQSSHQILLQMPGVQDPERVKNLLKGESRLELVHVVSPPSPNLQTYATEAEAIASVASGGTLPANRRVLKYVERMDPTSTASEEQTREKRTKWAVVEAPAIIDGSELRNASAVPTRAGGTEDYEINFSLKKNGADKFGAWTGAHINEYMGVVLNDEVQSIAFIKSQIFDSGQIEGQFTKQSAEDLALTLRSGALPAPIEYLEERTVGPSLGQDSINSGVRASLVGLALVVLFMLIYYRGAGINAVVALVLNMILMMAGLILFGATLTLPGIAGIILTIGMAVDSNVLIFERIREELGTGKTIPSAVEQGFGRAFVTIIDTHVTTIVSSLFLFVFGTGPIRGFAVTLVIGLLVNLFSAVYVSRTIFIWELGRKEKVESLSI
ncbi:MAG TPA: protein translocase subunit SecD [Pyrinomonadaceae bacterium]|jgi:preprotein translocase subunit SecD|nr:protein translocase subunit SecD [Pyrinomonadaceae bacterium]